MLDHPLPKVRGTLGRLSLGSAHERDRADRASQDALAAADAPRFIDAQRAINLCESLERTSLNTVAASLTRSRVHAGDEIRMSDDAGPVKLDNAT